MSFDLVFTPAGHIMAVELTAEKSDAQNDCSAEIVDGRLKRVAKAFAAGQGEGLFVLATERFDGSLPPSFAYWRDFAARYLTALCHTPDGADAKLEPIAPPEEAELAAIAPECPADARGRVSQRSRAGRRLGQTWTPGFAARWPPPAKGCRASLKQRAPLWHQVGRVCFHLAENRRNEDYPFAFLATYAPGMAGSARVQYQPLSRALQEFAGAKNKKALVQLLSPVQLASRAKRAGQGVGRFGRHLPAAGLDAPRGLSFPQGRAGVRGKRRPGAAARLVEETPPAARRRDHRRCKAEEVRRQGDARLQGATGAGRPGAHRGRMARVDGGRRRTGPAARPMGRSRPPEAAARRSTTGSRSKSRPRTGCRSSRGCGCWRACPPIWPTTADDDEDRQWSFVHAGQWLGEMLAKMRSPENLQPAEPADDLEGDAAEVSGDGRQLAAVPVEPGAGGLPGRRHGTGQDDPSAWRCCRP